MIFKNKLITSTIVLSLFPALLLAESIEFKPSIGTSSPAVTFNFEGQILEPASELREVVDTNTQSEIEAFLSKFLKASREGDKETFLSLYAPHDRPQMQEFVDGDLWESNVGVAKTEVSAKLLAVINYGEYQLCIVVSKYSNFADLSEMVYPVLKSSSGELFMTQDLGSDPFVISYAFPIANELTARLLK